MRQRLAASLLSIALVLHASSFARAYPGAPTSPPTAEAKAEAKKRFDKAIALFSEKDPKAALAELLRAWELTGNLVVLYNIGLVHDALGELVLADDALTEVLAASPDPLKPEQHKHAMEVQAHARARIGSIVLQPKVKTSDVVAGESDPLQGAVVELDGVDVARWPIAAPLRAKIGEHVVGLLVAGYAPARASVTIAGETTTTVPLELVSMEGQAAQLSVVTKLVAAKVVVDGEVAGTTPLLKSLPVAPGKHVVELVRPGYATASTVVVLSSGGSGVAKLEPIEDASAIASLGAKIVVHVSQPDALVAIDGKPREAMNAIAIAPGAHHLHVERTGYLAWERDVDVPGGATTTFEAELEETPETKADREATSARRRTLGWIEVVSGAVFTGVGAGLFVWYGKNKSDIDARTDAFVASQSNGGECDASGGHSLPGNGCSNIKDGITADRNNNDIRLGFAIGSSALGLASLGLGLYTLSKTPSSSDAAKTEQANAPTLQFGVLGGRSTWGLTLGGVF